MRINNPHTNGEFLILLQSILQFLRDNQGLLLQNKLIFSFR